MRMTEWFDLFTGMMVISTTAVVLAGLIGLALKRRASTRHAVWLCALTVVLFSPAFAWLGRALVLPPINWPRLAAKVEPVARRPEPATPFAPAPSGPMIAQMEQSPVPFIDVDQEPRPARIMPARSVTAPGTQGATPRGLVVTVWFLGALGLLGRLAWGVRGVARLRRTAWPFAACDAVTHKVASALGVGIDRLPALGVSDCTSQPLTLGVIRPLVLIPEGLADRLSADVLRDVLIHECAHALRRDTLVGLLQRFAAILCWPNPLVHLMNRALESAREELCDNYVLRASSPADYASSLLSVAESRPFAADLPALLGLPMIARRGSLESRIAALIDPRRHIEISSRRGAVVALALLFLTAGAAVAAVRFDDAEQAPLAAFSTPIDPTKTRIEGIIVDESGKPAGDVLVRSWAILDEFPETRTGPDGSFALDIEPSPLIHVLASNADGSLQAFNRHVGGYMASQRRLTTRMILKPARATTVRVTDLQGAPIVDASVVVHDEFAAFWQSRTDARGEARIHVAANARPWAAYAFKSGVGLDYFEDEQYWPGRAFSPLPETIDLVLNGALTVKVQAVDGGGQPVPRAILGLGQVWKGGKRSSASLCAYPYMRSTTDQDGLAVCDSLPADLIQSPVFSVSSRSPYVAETSLFDLNRLDEKVVTTVTWKTPVSGRVFAADGTPTSGIMVRAEGQGRPFGQGSHSTRTGADGSYRLALHPGASYLIGVVDDDWAAPSQGGIIPREGAMIQNIDFRLEPGTLVTGRVTNGVDHAPAAGEIIALTERGANVEHLTVEAHDGQSSQFGAKTETLHRWTTTDPDGRYTFRVGPGAFSMPDKRSRIDLPLGFAFTHDDESSHNFQINKQVEVTHDLEIVEIGDKRSFVVTVHEADRAGAPVPNAWIAAATTNSERSWRIAPHTGRADAHGRLKTRHMNQAMYLFARSADGARGGFGFLGPDDDEASVTIEDGTTVSGRVVSADGTPIPRAVLYAYLAGPPDADENARLEGSPNPADRDAVQIVLTCDARGRYQLPGLPVGTRLHLTQPPQVGRGQVVEPNAVDLVVKNLNPVAAPDVVAKTTAE